LLFDGGFLNNLTFCEGEESVWTLFDRCSIDYSVQLADGVFEMGPFL